MGWKTQTILIRAGRLDGGPDQLLADLGYDKRRKIGDASFERAGAGSIWLGSIGDCIVIYAYFASEFIEDPSPENENSKALKNALFRRFPQADVAALFLHSVVEGWGFAVFRRGDLIRRQHGYDGMVLCDEGARLPAEEAYLSRFHRSEADGNFTYRDPHHPEYGDLTDADLGEPLVFEICRSFTGFSLDDPAIGAIQGADFWLNDDEVEFQAKLAAARARPWWKFWN